MRNEWKHGVRRLDCAMLGMIDSELIGCWSVVFFFTVLIMQSRTVSIAVCFIPRVSGLFIYNGVYELILSLLYAIHKLGLRDVLFALSRRMVNDSAHVLLDVLREELARKHYPATIVLLIRRGYTV